MPTKAYKLPASWLKEGAAVINVSTFKNVDEEEVLKVCVLLSVCLYLAVSVFFSAQHTSTHTQTHTYPSSGARQRALSLISHTRAPTSGGGSQSD